jgi:phosphoenolpyruvate---glycerone phosphotransferase subunit DhaL
MSGGLTTESLRSGVARIASAIDNYRDELNALDGQLGDGDLGVTLANGTARVRAAAEGLPDDVGMALLECAKTLTGAGASSYTTLLATGLMAAAKEARGRTELPWSEVPHLLEVALDRMAARGRSAVGDKTVLDALDAAVQVAGNEEQNPAMLARAVDEAVGARIEAMRGQPCRQGRARIFAEKSRQMDDPGMVAMKRMTGALVWNIQEGT